MGATKPPALHRCIDTSPCARFDLIHFTMSTTPEHLLPAFEHFYHSLTQKERAVFDTYHSSGRNVSIAADTLWISPSTVYHHLRRISKRFQASAGRIHQEAEVNTRREIQEIQRVDEDMRALLASAQREIIVNHFNNKSH